MESPNRYKSSTGMTDMLFNLLVGFVFLFVIAFILINPPTKQSDVPTKAEFLIIIEWNEDFNDDVDLWVRDPNQITVSFLNKEGGLLNLEKDDLGYSNDVFRRPDGTTDVLRINREVVTVRGTQAGTYSIAAHIYNRGITNTLDANGVRVMGLAGEGTIKLTVIKVNPYREEYVAEYIYHRRREEILMIDMIVDNEGNVTGIEPLRKSMITGRNSNTVGPVGGGTPAGLQSNTRRDGTGATGSLTTIP